MNNNVNILSGLMLGIQNNIELPTEFRDFLDLDDQGMEGFDFMLKDSELSKKIPKDVRLQYEALYSAVSTQLCDNITHMIEMLNEMKSNPKETTHNLIQSLYEEQKQNEHFE